jgi:hypothetical protein
VTLLINLTEQISLLDNQNRIWIKIFSYRDINTRKNSTHYKRYFYDIKTQKVNNIQEVKYHYLNDSVIYIAFRSGISDSLINKKQFVKFNYYTHGNPKHEPWFNYYFNFTLEELKAKLIYPIEIKD